MIVDITNEVYTNLKNNLSTATVLPHYPSTPPTFPCVIIEEMDNIVDRDTINTEGDQYSEVTLELNIFSNSQDMISQTKVLRDQIDSVLSGQYRMTRTYSRPVPNFLDTNVYRYQMRYTFLIDSTKTIYRR